MNTDEKLCLQWNDFKENVSSAFGDLRQDKEFTDVTLACEDGQQVEAHKVVLIASSPFFLNLLKKNKHPHPQVFMRGVKYEDLVSMVDFLYNEEANVHQENLNSFLSVAEELRLKGLRKQEDLYSEAVQEAAYQTGSNQDHVNESKCDTTLDRKVKSMMIFGENILSKVHGRVRICKEWGKEGQRINIMNHIEANHILNICIPCNHCGKTFKTRSALDQHVHKYHSQGEPSSQYL